MIQIQNNTELNFDDIIKKISTLDIDGIEFTNFNTFFIYVDIKKPKIKRKLKTIFGNKFEYCIKTGGVCGNNSYNIELPFNILKYSINI